MNHESRYSPTTLSVETRAAGAAPVVSGYAAKFNIVSHDLGGFKEVILPDAFDLADPDLDVICNCEHLDCEYFARTKNGTLRLSTDDVGLLFEADPADTLKAADNLKLIERKDFDGCSFCFQVIQDEWSEGEDGTPLRQLIKVELRDVSCVFRPAYPETELALRSLAAWQEQRSKARIVPLSIRKRKLDLDFRSRRTRYFHES